MADETPKIPSRRILVTGSRDWGMSSGRDGLAEVAIINNVLRQLFSFTQNDIAPWPEVVRKPDGRIDVDADYERPMHAITLVHGGCPTGADQLADDIFTKMLAEDDSCKAWTDIYSANWELHGSQAGPLRNSQMVLTKPDICYAFIRNNSAGATNCTDLAKAAGIPTYIFRSDPPKAWQVKK